MSMWMTCPKCDVEHHSGKFCYECGTPLIEYKVYCECGERLYQRNNFCKNCGKPNPKKIDVLIQEYWKESKKEEVIRWT